MAYVGPGLDDILLGISHIVESDVERILVVAEVDGGHGTTVDRLLTRAGIVEICRGIAIGMGDAEGRLEIIFVARGGVYLPTLIGYRRAAAAAYPRQLAEIGLVEQLRAEIRLIEAPVVTHGEHQVGGVGGDAYHLAGLIGSPGTQRHR